MQKQNRNVITRIHRFICTVREEDHDVIIYIMSLTCIHTLPSLSYVGFSKLYLSKDRLRIKEKHKNLIAISMPSLDDISQANLQLIASRASYRSHLHTEHTHNIVIDIP